MFPCEIKAFPTRSTLSIRFRSPVQELSAHFGQVYGAIGAYLAELGAQDQGEAVFAAYHNMDMQDLDIVAGFTVAKPLPGQGEIQADEIPGGLFALCHYTGPYDQCGPAYEELAQYAAQHGYQPGGVAYEWYLNGPEVPPQELKTDIAFPVVPLGEAAKA